MRAVRASRDELLERIQLIDKMHLAKVKKKHGAENLYLVVSETKEAETFGQILARPLLPFSWALWGAIIAWIMIISLFMIFTAGL